MSCDLSSMDVSGLYTPTASVAAWDVLWRYHPPDTKDDALLAREARSLRWATIVGKLDAAFGSIQGLRTIELGSGRGDLSALLARNGARVTLLDSSARALRQASHRFDRLGLTASYHLGDITGSLDPWRGQFDVALSSGVIEHFGGSDRTRVVLAHHDVLRPGGMAIISVPNAWCIPYRLWKSYLERRGWWPYGLELPYTERELVRRARRIGFERIEARCMGFWQSVGDHLSRTLLGWRPDWVDRRSCLDGWLGLVLLLLARRSS